MPNLKLTSLYPVLMHSLNPDTNRDDEIIQLTGIADDGSVWTFNGAAQRWISIPMDKYESPLPVPSGVLQ
jgi:hypothetical protein